MYSSKTIVELCEREFECFIDALFEKNRAQGDDFYRAPIIDRLYSSCDDEYVAKMKRMVRAAVHARKSFREHAPAWAPPLPLNFADIDRARLDESNRVNLVGHYACSLLLLEYDYQTHPLFKDYACGLMAYPHAPDYLREDPELLSEFPPKLLAGIDAGLNWSTPEKIAEDKQASLRCVQFWRDRGASEKWLRLAVDEHNDYFSTISGLEFLDQDILRVGP